MSVLTGYIISFIGGGFLSALLTRYFVLRDRRLKKLTLKAVKEEILSIVPLTIGDKHFSNLISKEFKLINDTKHDFDSLNIIFEFDQESEIVHENTLSHLGENKCDRSLLKLNECNYNIRHFNRSQSITFEFRVAGITKNFFSAIVDSTGIELTIVPVKGISKPKISPSKIVSKIDIAQQD